MRTVSLVADFYAATRNASATLSIYRIENSRRVRVTELPVTDKRNARAIAKAHGAEPWNF